MARASFRCLGTGSVGAKAGGLARVAGLLDASIAPAFAPDIAIGIPPLTVVATDVFERFIDENRLSGLGSAVASDRDIAAAFDRATLPAVLLADLEAWLAKARLPLAVRSSSLLEDAAAGPLAGVYATRMLANSHPDVAVRREELARAIKYVYASTFFRKARDYAAVAGGADAGDRMAVIIQEVVGTESNGRFYPHVSGVARSLNFYPFGLARPDDGVADLALGMGKTIVQDGMAWSYSPACPQANPPYNRPLDLVQQSQREFWAIDLGRVGSGHADGDDAMRQYGLTEAEEDGALRYVASTYLADDDRIVAGVDRRGARIVDFAPLLKSEIVPLTPLIIELLERGRGIVAAPVEIEFAMAFGDHPRRPARFGFLQIRPMADAYSPVQVQVDELGGPRALVASDSALGNGDVETIQDVVYVKPHRIQPRDAKAVTGELEALNRALTGAGRPYLLIGPGRWGSSDPSAGIPVDFAQISGARVIVEAAFPETDLMLSQGSHFFHNITSFRVLYLAVSDRNGRVDWAWLDARPAIADTGRLRHLRLPAPLRVKVDGRSSRGVVLR